MFVNRNPLKLLLAVAVLWVWPSACGGGGGGGSSERIVPFARGSFTFSSDRSEVAADFSRFVVVQASVNGRQGRFVLDTGADSFVLSPAFAEAVGVQPSGEAQLQTVIGVSLVALVRVDQFALGNVVGVDFDAAVLETGEFDGIIGIPFFENAVVSLDYEREKVGLYDPAQYTASSVLPNASQIAVQNFTFSGLTLNGRPVGPVRLDTGSSGGLHVASVRVGAVLDSVSNVSSTTFSASNGSLPGVAFIADTLGFAEFRLKDQLVVAQSGGLQSGLLGNLVLKQFYLVLDLPRGQVRLRQTKELRFEL